MEIEMTPQISLRDLKDLIDYNVVSTNKINTIKTIRAITGSTLKEALDFFEQVLIPAIQNQDRHKNPKSAIGSFVDNADKSIKGGVLPPPMYLVGHSYRQLNRNTVLIVGVSNFNTEDETIYSIDDVGNVVHRYNRRNFGIVTGTNQNNPDPRNLEILR